jgi:hypothetical protein
VHCSRHDEFGSSRGSFYRGTRTGICDESDRGTVGTLGTTVSEGQTEKGQAGRGVEEGGSEEGSVKEASVKEGGSQEVSSQARSREEGCGQARSS